MKEKKRRLNEILVKDVFSTIASKAVLKTMFQYCLTHVQTVGSKLSTDYMKTVDKEKLASGLVTPNDLLNAISFALPDDTTDKEKGLSAAWLKRYFLSSFSIFEKYFLSSPISKQKVGFLAHKLESYFKFHRFMQPEERDLMNISDSVDLELAIVSAEKLYDEWAKQKEYLDAEKGTEVIYEDKTWKVFIPNNKGAACELGKGTQWCTAAPGLNYYSAYHSDDDPLFIFHNKKHAEQKFQFHYGSAQFMDKDDLPVGNVGSRLYIHLLRTLHDILIKSVGNRFPFLKDAIIKTDIGTSIKQIHEHEFGTHETPHTLHQDEFEQNFKDFSYKDIVTEQPYAGKDIPSEVSTIRHRHDEYNYNLVTIKFSQMVMNDMIDGGKEAISR